MKLAIFSDCHFGYAYGTERQEDCFIQAKEAMDLSADSDILLLAGDLFDSRVPRPEVFTKALRLFAPKSNGSPGVRLISFPREVAITQRPVVSIFGTHERRGKGLINPVQSLETAGFMTCLHCETIIFEKDGERVAIHGMSGVPEAFSKPALQAWGPKPVEGCTNVLMLHQNLKEYIFSDPLALGIDELPKGFDLIISGHIHWSEIREFEGGKLLVAGSTVCTQQRKSETEPKKVFFLDTKTKELSFKDLQTPRLLLLEGLEFKDAAPSEVVAKAEASIREIASREFPKPPLVRLAITGSLSKEYTRSDVSLCALNDIAQGKIILTVDNALSSEKFSSQRKTIEELRANRMSIGELGMELLKKNLSSVGPMPVEDFFHHLAEGEADILLPYLKGEASEDLKEIAPAGNRGEA